MRAIKVHTFQKEKYTLVFGAFILGFTLLAGRLCYLMIFRSEELSKKALNIEQRERTIKAARGKIYDRNGIVLADNQAVCSVSVIYYQIKESQKVIKLLSQKLALSEEEVKKKVEKVSSREKIKSNVPKSVADEIREAGLDGVKVDEDYKRYYPFGTLASKVLGFAGADNQGILGIESRYDDVLKGTDGKILTLTDYQGIEIENAAETRVEPVNGNDLYLSVDYNVQCYVQQAAEKVLKVKKAKRVSVILMNPQNGEIYALVSLPEYDLNEPFVLTKAYEAEGKNQNDKLNDMWRNPVISDSYEPGSTFKIITATAALEERKVTLQDSFFCPGFKIVEDRKIRCHKTQGHGSETFKQGVMNSCNPVFMEIGARVGAKDMLRYYHKLGLYERTGVDLPGEANSIMHKLDKIGAVELATMSFGQSIQITPLQLMRAVSAGINDGRLVTPHFALEKKNPVTKEITEYEYKEKAGAVSKETSQTLREVLEAVVAEGTGKNGQVEGYRVGGKTATSEKLPRRSGKYISSFLGFAPANHPQILGLVLIDEPQGTYYGGVIAAPVMAEIFQNVLPYLDNL
ncbi:peptidoglycan D,D-transpeptidase FtsI family protein [Anaerobutyricum hallii]|uniref:Penicillin-binding protein, transpeptidase domain protein n=1 Tax=Anaerobutyricum hallii DSM 3353 TaxID=411469 RepID=C0EY79_9FIRM|nr:penicillin-binding transpeptidase domain-containing protein [Anaerobutyricum hallii]EEG35790.1 penicillin-binding protein, transpeptidase domain protein [Anaerobutyricum hallii DSM 3353]